MDAPTTADELAERLVAACAAVGPMVVAFSGGVDSALLGVAAQRALPGAAWLVTADSGSLADGELEHCRAFAEQWSLPWRSAETTELADARYLANDTDRCYWCKSALMDQLEPIAAELGASVVLGVNVDDLGDHRPGQRAAAERGARFPMVDAGLTKAAVRRLALHWGLDVWDRPAMPCLSSRIPYGTAVSVPLFEPHRSRRSGGACVRLPRRARAPLRRHRAHRTARRRSRPRRVRSPLTSPPP